MCHVVFSLQVQRPEEWDGSLRIIEPGAFGPVALATNTVSSSSRIFLPIGSSMGASHCKDEEWRPDLYLKVAASIVPKELDITSQGVADMSDEDVLRIIDAVRSLPMSN
ncbi:MAG: hypothetical protein WBZ51_32730 [Xanthobacteraceae bacterium]